MGDWQKYFFAIFVALFGTALFLSLKVSKQRYEFQEKITPSETVQRNLFSSEFLELDSPSPEALAKKLGYENPETALKEASIFVERIRKGFLPNSWESECKEKYSLPLCWAAEDYFGPKMESSSSNKTSYPFKFRFSNVAKLQSADFQGSLSRMKKFSYGKLKQWADESLKHKECPRYLSLAIARRVEAHLDDHPKEALELIVKLDEHGAECLTNQDEVSELTHLRAALFQVALEIKYMP